MPAERYYSTIPTRLKSAFYTAYFASNKSLAQNRALLTRFMRAMGQAMRWLNDPANEKAVIEIMMQRLKIDEATAERTYKLRFQKTKLFAAKELSMLPD